MKNMKRGDTGWTTLLVDASHTVVRIEEFGTLGDIFKLSPVEIRVVNPAKPVEVGDDGEVHILLEVNPASRKAPDGEHGGWLMSPEDVYPSEASARKAQLLDGLKALRSLMGRLYARTEHAEGPPPFRDAFEGILAKFDEAIDLATKGQ